MSLIVHPSETVYIPERFALATVVCASDTFDSVIVRYTDPTLFEDDPFTFTLRGARMCNLPWCCHDADHNFLYLKGH